MRRFPYFRTNLYIHIKQTMLQVLRTALRTREKRRWVVSDRERHTYGAMFEKTWPTLLDVWTMSSYCTVAAAEQQFLHCRCCGIRGCCAAAALIRVIGGRVQHREWRWHGWKYKGNICSISGSLCYRRKRNGFSFFPLFFIHSFIYSCMTLHRISIFFVSEQTRFISVVSNSNLSAFLKKFVSSVGYSALCYSMYARREITTRSRGRRRRRRRRWKIEENEQTQRKRLETATFWNWSDRERRIKTALHNIRPGNRSIKTGSNLVERRKKERRVE